MGFSCWLNLFSVLFILLFYFLHVIIGINTITSSQFIKDPETLLSKDGYYAFGFFSPENSTNRYVGIWWKSEPIIIWVANRNQPLNDSNGTVTISEDGNLVVLNGQKHVIWSSNVSNIASNTSSQFSDYGNLVLLESRTGNMLWQSIQEPTDTLLPGMKLSINKRTGEKSKLRSWKSPSDPSVGSFSCSSVERGNILEVFIWNETRPYWRSGPWNGRVLTGIDSLRTAYFNGFQGGDDGEGNINIYFTIPDNEVFVIYNLNSQGKIEESLWNDEKKELQVKFTTPKSECDVYGICGEFAICNSLGTPICRCLKGFVPMNIEEWNRNNWTDGCVRKTPLQCERVNNETTSTKEDGFLKLQMVKVPDFAEGVAVAPDICRRLCLENCSCTAYSNDAGIGCMSWTGNLLDIQQLQMGGLDLYFRVAHAELDPSKNKLLDWRTRYNIIEGIARGLLYLHRDSRLRIIHTDLKTSNILLDEKLNPKISDFGMARIFGGRENQANTTRVVGTYGYMSPEYAMQGLFSEKSDVFSFGVLILEIISGRRNSSFYDNEHALNLLGFVWIQWKEGNILTLIDPGIYDHSHHNHVSRCIHIGLLCVQESAVDRPTMATVISMLISEAAFLPPPSQPAFILRRNMLSSKSPEENQSAFSINNVSITDICGR